MNKLFYLILVIICISIALGSCKNHNGGKKRSTDHEVNQVTINHKTVDCYAEKLKWVINDSTFIDTLFFFRNLIENDSAMRVSCVLKAINTDCEALIFNDKHIRATIEAMRGIHRNFIMTYEEQHPAIILSLYIIDLKTLETYEWRRYQIINNEITGINILPNIVNEFVPYDEFYRWVPMEM